MLTIIKKRVGGTIIINFLKKNSAVVVIIFVSWVMGKKNWDESRIHHGVAFLCKKDCIHYAGVRMLLIHKKGCVFYAIRWMVLKQLRIEGKKNDHTEVYIVDALVVVRVQKNSKYNCLLPKHHHYWISYREYCQKR